MKISFFFRWYDLWVGAYYRRPTEDDDAALYICPLPMCGVKLSWPRTYTHFKCTPDMEVQEIDVSTLKTTDPTIAMMIGDAEKGPAGPVQYYGPTIPPIRWWQFWRWHLCKRYRRECEDASRRFHEDFGPPTEVDLYDGIMARLLPGGKKFMLKRTVVTEGE